MRGEPCRYDNIEDYWEVWEEDERMFREARLSITLGMVTLPTIVVESDEKTSNSI